MSRTLRLFVAAYPPQAVVDRWLRAARGMLPGDIRVLEATQVHLTLTFLGEQDERELPEIRESIARSVSGFCPFDLSAREITMLPERGLPRLLAVATDLPRPLAEIQRRLAQRLALDRSRRSVFLPHFTLARFPGRAVERAARGFCEPPFRVSEICLMRSRLLPDGAVHDLDKRYLLQPA